ncbi:MAG: endonuclease/exonuclease/phosphatase family protein [Actinomycetota bacterium]|nr:endonuclease/exonuclease/phosphatase family protein [Actinomycetota bacterium]
MTATTQTGAGLDVGVRIAAGALAVAATVRAFGPGGSPHFVAIQTAAPYVLAPAFIVAAVGALRGLRVVTAVALVVMALHVVWTSDDLAVGRPADVEGALGELRIVTSNVLFANDEIEELGRELAATDADVIALQELTPAHWEALEGSGVFDGYSERIVDPRRRARGSAILSRLPLRDGEVIDVGGWPMTSGVLTVGNERVRLVNVHTAAPTAARNIDRWRAQLDQLADVDRFDEDHVIYAGDFNATFQHEPLRGLLDAGMEDAFAAAGRGMGATWPSGERYPPLFRIDHVFTSDAIRVTGVGTGAGTGSDHRPVVADLAIVGP